MTMLWVKIIVVVLALLLVRALLRKASSAGTVERIAPEGERSDADVQELLRLDRKIEAIKVYRELHGVGLRQAKEAVEQLQRQL